MAFLWSSWIEPRRGESQGCGTRRSRARGKAVLLVRFRVRIGLVLVGLLAVPMRGFGVLPGRLVVADHVVVGRLEVVMSGGRVVGGIPVVVLGRSPLPGRRRRGRLGGRGYD
jgi:hypothetical protein